MLAPLNASRIQNIGSGQSFTIGRFKKPLVVWIVATRAIPSSQDEVLRSVQVSKVVEQLIPGSALMCSVSDFLGDSSTLYGAGGFANILLANVSRNVHVYL